MALKRTLIVMTMLLFCAPVIAQESYVILATKGTSGLFAKPSGISFQKGDRFVAKRTVDGKEVDVAQVSIALVDSRYYGVKVETPLADSRLRKGDYLIQAQASGGLNESLSFLDQFDSGASTPPAASNDDPLTSALTSTPPASTPPASNNFSLDNVDSLSNFDDIFSINSPGTSTVSDTENLLGGESGNSSQYGPTVSPINDAGSFLGISLAAMLPISNTANRYAVGPGFGLQAVTDIGLRSNLRWSVQHTILQPSSSVKSALNAAGSKQKSGLTLLTVSIQPRIMNHFVLDLGVGYYRQFDEINTGARRAFSAKNAIGTLTGLGYHFQVGRSSSVMLLGTGNFYFLEGDNAAFFSFLAGYFFNI